MKARLPLPEPPSALLPRPRERPRQPPPRSRSPLQVRDAVAVIRYLVWLEKNVPSGAVDEFSGAELLDKFRG